MEVVIKLKIIDCSEEEWVLGEDAKGKFQNLTDEDLAEVVAEIIRESIVHNELYYHCDDIEAAVQLIQPTVLSILLNPSFRHLREDYRLLVEMVSFLTFRLA